MTITETIEQLVALRIEHGDLQVKEYKTDFQVGNIKPQIKYIRVNKQRESRIEFWYDSPSNPHERGEKVVCL